MSTTRKTAVIIGASSGIGRALAKHFSANGYDIAVTARRSELLESLAKEVSTNCHIATMDVRQASAMKALEALLAEIGEVDVIVVNAGTGAIDTSLPWSNESETIETNVSGFSAMANVAYQHFSQRTSGKHGHIVGISSIAAIRGGPAPAYFASKAFVSNYLQGLRSIIVSKKLNISVTDVKPGFVDTAMAQGANMFWVASPEKAAAQIYSAVVNRKKHIYVSKRWRLIAWVLKVLPDALYHRML